MVRQLVSSFCPKLPAGRGESVMVLEPPEELLGVVKLGLELEFVEDGPI